MCISYFFININIFLDLYINTDIITKKFEHSNRILIMATQEEKTKALAAALGQIENNLVKAQL